MKRALDDAVAAWNRFFFEPRDMTTLGVFRIVYGLLATLWTLSRLPYLFTFYGPDGILPEPPPTTSLRWGLLNVVSSVPAVSVLWLATLVAAIALMLGRRPRVAALVLFLGLMAFDRRNDLVGNAGDDLMRYLAFYLVLAPSSAALSLDRWRAARDSFWEAERRAPWTLRLLQIQLSLIYVSTVWSKLQGETWRNGTALSYALRIDDAVRLGLPEWLLMSRVVSEWLTFGTLFIELALGVLVWNRRARPWVLLLGVALHLGIEVTLMVGFFSAAMICLYLVFVPPESMNRVLGRARQALTGRLAATPLLNRYRRQEGSARSS